MLQRENGTATAEESVFLGSNPEVTRNDDFNSVFQYGNKVRNLSFRLRKFTHMRKNRYHTNKILNKCLESQNMKPVMLQDQSWCLRQRNDLISSPAKEGGFVIHVKDSPVRWAYGKTKEEAWRNCRLNMMHLIRDRMLRSKNTAIADLIKSKIKKSDS